MLEGGDAMVAVVVVPREGTWGRRLVGCINPIIEIAL